MPYSEEQLDILSAELGEKEPSQNAVAGATAWEKYEAGWRPHLNPGKQVEAYNDIRAKYILCDGERGSGKTWVLIDKLILHCLENLNATTAIITRESSQSKDGGAWDKLVHNLLPEWSKGIGLEFTQPRYDVETHKPYLWITNRFGFGSLVRCISLQYGEHVADKIKGKEYSFVLFDEAQTTDDDADSYFSAISQQVGRKANVEGIQQLCFAANPKGPSHWLYKRFFEYPIDEETGDWNDDYARYHIPIQENIDNLPKGYYDRVLEAVRNDPIEEARMVRGEWIDRPTGRAMFRGVFAQAVHVKGDLFTGLGLLPRKGYAAIASYDLGPAHSSIHFSQYVATKAKMIWVVFDELNFVGQYMPYKEIVPKLIERMKYWETIVGEVLQWDHISDSSAFNQVRSDGNFDVLTVREKSIEIGREILMRPAPKGPNSIAERSRLLTEMLKNEEIYISAICPKTIEMLNMIESKKPGREYEADIGLKPAKSPFVHVFDSLTYGIIAVRISGIIPMTVGSAASGVVYLGN